MLDKISFSDIYKFLASVGLVLIITALLLPVFLFQVDILKNYRGVDVKLITDTAKQSIQCQENLLYLALHFWWLIFSLCFLLGLIIFICGIKKWSNRQAILDKMQDLDLEEKEKRLIKKASELDVNKKRSEDVDEIEDDNSKKATILQTYKTIENKVDDSITVNDPRIRINRNAKVNNFVYDLIVIKRLSSQNRLHIVCEIKYYQKEIFYSYIQHGISSFLLAAANYEKYVAENQRGLIVKYYMIWICASQSQKQRLKSYTEKAKSYADEKGIGINIILKLDSELDSIKNELLQE